MTAPQLRAGQVITTFGPGAMVDLPDCSVIIGGLDNWKYDLGNFHEVQEPRLVSKLRDLLNVQALTLRKPPPSNDDPQNVGGPSITVWSFPEWYVVQAAVTTKAGHRARRLVHQQQLEKNKFKDVNRKSQKVIPVRFVRACPKGHVGDIDWKAFIHRGESQCGRDLWLEERGTSGDLSEVFARCECGKSRGMNEASLLALKALGHCNGAQPWLGPRSNVKCGQPSRLLIRSASNAYFAQTLSVISIPEQEDPLVPIVKALWDNYFGLVESVEELARERRRPDVRNAIDGYDDADVWRVIQEVRDGTGTTDTPVKEAEFDALADAKDELGADTPDGNFYARALEEKLWKEKAPWMANVERVVLVHRLREVIAQLGFTRFEAAGPDIQGELALDVERAPLAQELTWLPAIENRGEGIFIKFSSDAVEDWLKKPEVLERGRHLARGFKKWRDEHEGSSRKFPGLPYYMLHTLSHLLVTAISLDCGYPASSIRERVYAGSGQYGILIYTASSDAEGTLGGLVEAGRAIKGHLWRALELGSLCANDPVCAAHAPDEHDPLPLQGSACHGCVLISETSCEQYNDFLDRALVVETVEGLAAEFFPAVQ